MTRALADNQELTAGSLPPTGDSLPHYDLICLGCGPAGEKAATQAAHFGHRVALIERQPRPGGAMVNTGTIPSKALRETALLCSAFQRRPLPGMEFRLDRSISVARFMARRHMIEQQEHDRIEVSFDRHGIDVHCGSGRLADAHTVEVLDERGEVRETLRARFILIATGSSPLRPDHVPFDHAGAAVVDADGVLELARIPESMIIVGGGVIGCEYASIFAEMGVAITLIHNGPCVLPFVDEECRERLVATMKHSGVSFVGERSVKDVKPIDRPSVGVGVRVMLDDGAAIEGETLLWAAGRRSNTEGIGLDAAGVTVGERGLISVDANYCTNVPSIYAAGDVIGFPALAATSMEQGRIAACHMFGDGFKSKLASIMPIGLYTIPAISMIGQSEAEARKTGRDVVIGRASYRDNARGRMLGDEQGLLKCVFERGSGKLLGAAIVGEDATELIHIAQMALAHGDGIACFIDACFNYPSLSELYKYAAYSALQAQARDDARVHTAQAA